MSKGMSIWEGKSTKIGSIIMAPVQMAITLSVAMQPFCE